MEKEEAIQIESNQRQHHEVLEHQDRAHASGISADYALFALLKPTIQRDGNQWCVLYGEDLMVGIAGFGDTPYKAVQDWNYQWNKTADTRDDHNIPEKVH